MQQSILSPNAAAETKFLVDSIARRRLFVDGRRLFSPGCFQYRRDSAETGGRRRSLCLPIVALPGTPLGERAAQTQIIIHTADETRRRPFSRADSIRTAIRRAAFASSSHFTSLT